MTGLARALLRTHQEDRGSIFVVRDRRLVGIVIDRGIVVRAIAR